MATRDPTEVLSVSNAKGEPAPFRLRAPPQLVKQLRILLGSLQSGGFWTVTITAVQLGYLLLTNSKGHVTTPREVAEVRHY